MILHGNQYSHTTWLKSVENGRGSTWKFAAACDSVVTKNCSILYLFCRFFAKKGNTLVCLPPRTLGSSIPPTGTIFIKRFV